MPIYRQMLNLARAAWLILAVTMLLACSSTPTEEASRSIYALDKKILVMPVISLVKVFREDASRIHEELVRSLNALDYDCYVLSDEQYQTFRNAAFEESGSIYNPKVGDFTPLNEQTYVDSLVRQLDVVGEYDLLMFPELVLRKVPLFGESLRWDGVESRLIIQGQIEGANSLPREARGLSLQLTSYRPDGALKAVQYGGIAVPYYLDKTQKPSRFKLRRQVITTRNITSAIALALAPFKK